MVPVQFWHISILSPGYIMSLDNTPLAVLLFNVPLWATTVNTSYLTSAFYKLSHKAVRIKPLPVLTESNHTKSHCPVKSLHVFLFMLLWPSLTGIRVWRDSYPTKTSISYSLWRRICTPYSQDFITILWFPLCSEPLCFIQVYLLQTSTFVFAPLEESKPSCPPGFLQLPVSASCILVVTQLWSPIRAQQIVSRSIVNSSFYEFINYRINMILTHINSDWHEPSYWILLNTHWIN